MDQSNTTGKYRKENIDMNDELNRIKKLAGVEQVAERVELNASKQEGSDVAKASDVSKAIKMAKLKKTVEERENDDADFTGLFTGVAKGSISLDDKGKISESNFGILKSLGEACGKKHKKKTEDCVAEDASTGKEKFDIYFKNAWVDKEDIDAAIEWYNVDTNGWNEWDLQILAFFKNAMSDTAYATRVIKSFFGDYSAYSKLSVDGDQFLRQKFGSYLRDADTNESLLGSRDPSRTSSKVRGLTDGALENIIKQFEGSGKNPPRDIQDEHRRRFGNSSPVAEERGDEYINNAAEEYIRSELASGEYGPENGAISPEDQLMSFESLADAVMDEFGLDSDEALDMVNSIHTSMGDKSYYDAEEFGDWKFDMARDAGMYESVMFPKGSLERDMVEIIVEEMKDGKDAEAISEELAFTLSDVQAVVNHFKKKVVEGFPDNFAGTPYDDELDSRDIDLSFEYGEEYGHAFIASDDQSQEAIRELRGGMLDATDASATQQDLLSNIEGYIQRMMENSEVPFNEEDVKQMAINAVKKYT